MVDVDPPSVSQQGFTESPEKAESLLPSLSSTDSHLWLLGLEPSLVYESDT